MLFFYAVIINDYYHNNITRPNIENFRAISKPFCISTANFTLIGELVKHIFNDLPPDPYKTCLGSETCETVIDKKIG
jgi:hypothetical protein